MKVVNHTIYDTRTVTRIARAAGRWVKKQYDASSMSARFAAYPEVTPRPPTPPTHETAEGMLKRFIINETNLLVRRERRITLLENPDDMQLFVILEEVGIASGLLPIAKRWRT